MATLKTILIAIALTVALPVLAQGEVPAFCLATDPADPAYDITDFDPQRDADDWCKLAYHQPHKARRQLSKAVALVRSENNPNRFYWDPRIERDTEHIQLLRPWMAEQGWWIQWPQSASRLDHPASRTGLSDSAFTLRYFTADQRGLPAGERLPILTLTLYLRIEARDSNYDGRGYSTYIAYVRGHLGRSFRSNGGVRTGRLAYITADPADEPNRHLVTIRDRSDHWLSADVLTAAVHAGLDCLSAPAIEDWNFEDCEVTIEVD